nr:metal-sensitive transcriptional regulator [Paenibacillus xylaniclasticus]
MTMEREAAAVKEETISQEATVEYGGHCCTSAEESARKSHHSDKVKTSLMNRLSRIEGQVRGLKGLIEKDVYCDDVLNQIASVQSALNGVSKLLLENHLRSCVMERIQEGDSDVIGELLTTLNKLMK